MKTIASTSSPPRIDGNRSLGNGWMDRGDTGVSSLRREETLWFELGRRFEAGSTTTSHADVRHERSTQDTSPARVDSSMDARATHPLRRFHPMSSVQGTPSSTAHVRSNELFDTNLRTNERRTARTRSRPSVPVPSNMQRVVLVAKTAIEMHHPWR